MTKKLKHKSKIKRFIHCKKCVEEKTDDTQSYMEYSKLSVGYTDDGIQVWCERHNENVTHFDFNEMLDDYLVKEIKEFSTGKKCGDKVWRKYNDLKETV